MGAPDWQMAHGFESATPNNGLDNSCLGIYTAIHDTAKSSHDLIDRPDTTSGAALCSGVASNSCRMTDARSITTTYAYDTRDRLTSKTYSDSTHSITYAYGNGACNGITPTNGINRRTCMTDAAVCVPQMLA